MTARRGRDVEFALPAYVRGALRRLADGHIGMVRSVDVSHSVASMPELTVRLLLNPEDDEAYLVAAESRDRRPTPPAEPPSSTPAVPGRRDLSGITEDPHGHP